MLKTRIAIRARNAAQLATAGLSLALALPGLIAAPAAAQTAGAFDRGENVAVQDRPRPEYDAVGIQWGAVEIRPRLTVTVASEDNVFFEQNNARDDIAYSINPEIQARTTWSRNAAELTVGLTEKRYDTFDSENRTNEYASGQFRLDVYGDASITAGASLANLGEGRNAPDTPGGAAKPGDYDIAQAFVSGQAVFARMRFSARLTQRDFSYKPVPLIGGGFEDAPERDRKETEVAARAEYAVTPKTAVFAEASVENRDYERRPPAVAFDRDNDVRRLLVGLNFDIGALARGEIAVGGLDQSFDAPGLGGASGLAMAARAEWFPRELTTVTLAASRRVEETNVGPAASFVISEGSARVDHELLHNVIISARLGVGQRNFEGLARKDDLASAGVGVRYLVNRTAEIGAGWDLDQQDSSGAARDRDYDSSRLLLSVTLRR